MSNPSKKIDFVAFSELRPGVLYTDCKDILLSHWRKLRAADEGKIYPFKYTCSLCIDVEGKIGKVSYFSSFPPKRVIENLRIGISMQDALAQKPNLKEEHCDKEGFRRFSQLVSLNNKLTLSFRNDSLVSIEIENPSAIYPKKEEYDFSKDYPQPVIEQNKLFKDDNLKLVVLGMLQSDGHIDLGKPEEMASFVLGRYIDFDNDTVISGYHSIDACRNYLIHYPLSVELLAKVDKLYCEASLDIYSYIFRYWDGETNEFDVTSLQGVEHLPSLKEISIHSLADFSTEEQQFNQQLMEKGIVINEFY